MIQQLPHPLWKALHIFPPGLGATPLRLVLSLVVVGLLLLWWRRHRRKKRLLPPMPVTVPRPVGSFKSRVEEIVGRAISEKQYRRGFHLLAAASRGALSRRTGLSFERMTVSEMGSVLSGEKLIETMRMLEDHQFRREAPRASDLEIAGRAVISTLSRGGRIGLRKGLRRG